MARRHKRTPDEISATPEAKAVREAVKMIGGAKAAGLLVGRCAQAVQKWTEFPEFMSPRAARTLSRATGYRVPVSRMLPDIYGELTAQELGYLPAAYPEQK